MELDMTLARKRLVHVDTTPFYHCITRCVRRAFLCGEDVVTGKNFDHRKAWVVEKLKQLSDAFCIDICAYAVMSNHTHVVLHVDKESALNWSLDEVIVRWHKLFKGTLLTQRYANVEERSALSEAERLTIEQTA